MSKLSLIYMQTIKWFNHKIADGPPRLDLHFIVLIIYISKIRSELFWVLIMNIKYTLHSHVV